MARLLIVLLLAAVIAVPAIAVVLNRSARWCWHEVTHTQQQIDQELHP